MSETPTDPRSDIGMGNLDPNRADELAQPNADDEVQVTVHGKYGRGPMPVEFRDALAEMVRLVKQAIDDGALPKRARQQAGAGRGGVMHEPYVYEDHSLGLTVRRYQMRCPCGQAGIAWIERQNAEFDVGRHVGRHQSRHAARQQAASSEGGEA